ncbi:MAG: alpha-L-rhamnosidase [Armatimonadota bacterium]
MRTGDRDPRTRRFVPARRVVLARGVANPENLLHDDASTCDLPPGSGVLVDFGTELHGAVRFDVPITEPKAAARVRVRFGESVSEALGEPDQDHAIHDHHVRLAWMGRTEVGETGFRFVHLENEDPVATIRLRLVQAVSTLREDPRLGTFACSDPRLEEIWRVGADTVHLCMQDHVWDGIKRDRLVWIGDLHPEAMVIATVFGDHPIVPDSLDKVRDETPLPGWMNGISSYSLWWIVVHADWHARFGDHDLLRAQSEYLRALLERIAERVDAEGGEQLDGHRFLEWPTARDPEAIDAGLQALVAIALAKGAGLLRALGREGDADRIDGVAARVRAVVRPTRSKQAAALQVLAGMRDAGSTNADLLANDPFRGLSTFYGYYVLEARAAAGDHQGCLDLMRTYWGGMLEMGATTFWEGFEIDWMPGATRIDEVPVAGRPDIHADFGDHCYVGLRHSLCHGWAAGPTAWLSEQVLGVRTGAHPRPWARIEPHLADLAWAEGTVPTAAGPIHVAHRRRGDGTIETRVEAPEGLELR